MPIYQYQCSECGHQLDELQKFSDDPLTVCPECKKVTLEKQVATNTAFCLMGYGWSSPGFTGARTSIRAKK